MSTGRPCVISIAGFDPSAGAGVLADIKCFEQHQVYGFGVCAALTIQTATDFLKNDWLDADQIIAQLAPLLSKFDVPACKIGLIKDIGVLQEVVKFLRLKNPMMKIVIDPVLKASAGYEFHDWDNGLSQFFPVLKLADLITPNYPELESLGGNTDVQQTAVIWAQHCAVLLKGGHNELMPGTDYLFEGHDRYELRPGVKKIYQKHGSGCVLSAAITANLALGRSLLESCRQAKNYIEHFLNSNKTRLGYHSHDR